MDIEGGNRHSGAKVVMYDQKDRSSADNQLWFEDRYGNIRSKLNECLVFDASGKIPAPSLALLLCLYTVYVAT